VTATGVVSIALLGSFFFLTVSGLRTIEGVERDDGLFKGYG
jgi:hypothetical protein